jgi:hypothetical protein
MMMKTLRALAVLAVAGTLGACAGSTQFGKCTASGDACIEGVAVTPSMVRGREITLFQVKTKEEYYDLARDRAIREESVSTHYETDEPLARSLMKSVIPTAVGVGGQGYTTIRAAKKSGCKDCGNITVYGSEAGAFSRSDALTDIGIGIGEGAVEGLMK